MNATTEAPVHRMFLVGCPRSGTTLLQSLLAAHPDVVSFPETHFFTTVSPGAGGRRERLHLASGRAPRALQDLDALGIAPDPAPPRLPSITVGGYSRRFQRRMDRSAREADATTWLEKTPSHARRIRQIQESIADPRFVHLIRDGCGVAASLRSAHLRDPVIWPSSEARDLVGLWRDYLGFSVPWIGHPGHAFVSYERLVGDTETVMRCLCEFAGLRADATIVADLLSGYRTTSSSLIGRIEPTDTVATMHGEPWKQNVAGDIVDRNDDRWEVLFTETERRLIAQDIELEHDTLRGVPFL